MYATCHINQPTTSSSNSVPTATSSRPQAKAATASSSSSSILTCLRSKKEAESVAPAYKYCLFGVYSIIGRPFEIDSKNFRFCNRKGVRIFIDTIIPTFKFIAIIGNSFNSAPRLRAFHIGKYSCVALTVVGRFYPNDVPIDI